MRQNTVTAPTPTILKNTPTMSVLMSEDRARSTTARNDPTNKNPAICVANSGAMSGRGSIFVTKYRTLDHSFIIRIKVEHDYIIWGKL